MAKNLGVTFTIGANVGSTVASAFASVHDKLRATQAAFASASGRARQLDNALAARRRLDSLTAKMRAEGATPEDLKNVGKLAEAYARAAKNAGVYGQSLEQIRWEQKRFNASIAGSQRSMAALGRVQAGRDMRAEEGQRRKSAIGAAFADIAPAMALAAPLKIGWSLIRP